MWLSHIELSAKFVSVYEPLDGFCVLAFQRVGRTWLECNFIAVLIAAQVELLNVAL